MEKVMERKLTLRSQIRARGELGPLQEVIAHRASRRSQRRWASSESTSLAKKASEQRATADLANTELVKERRKAEQSAKTIVMLGAFIEALSSDLTRPSKMVANEGLRANTTEASLREAQGGFTVRFERGWGPAGDQGRSGGGNRGDIRKQVEEYVRRCGVPFLP
jgi:hypothetical protein